MVFLLGALSKHEPFVLFEIFDRSPRDLLRVHSP